MQLSGEGSTPKWKWTKIFSFSGWNSPQSNCTRRMLCRPELDGTQRKQLLFWWCFVPSNALDALFTCVHTVVDLEGVPWVPWHPLLQGRLCFDWHQNALAMFCSWQICPTFSTLCKLSYSSCSRNNASAKFVAHSEGEDRTWQLDLSENEWTSSLQKLVLFSLLTNSWTVL